MNRIASVFVLTMGALAAQAQFSYNVNGSLYTQNFDTLAVSGTVARPTSSSATASVAGQAWTNNATLEGWVGSFENSTNVGLTTPGANGNWIGAGVLNTPTPHTIPTYDVRFIRIDNGAGVNGSLYNYGTTSATDRALGSLNSGGATTGLRNSLGLRIVNNTGGMLTQFTLRYKAEQWRRGDTPLPVAADRMLFSYRISSSPLIIDDLRANVTAGWTAVSSLDAVSTNLTSPVGAIDGNLTTNSTSVGGVVTGLTWNHGDELVLRWADFDRAGSDDGLAIDDLSFQAVPEPATMTALALGAAALLRRRKK